MRLNHHFKRKFEYEYWSLCLNLLNKIKLSISFNFQVLECIKLSEETTTSSSRIFVKIFFQELCEYMGLPKLNARLKDE